MWLGGYTARLTPQPRPQTWLGADTAASAARLRHQYQGWTLDQAAADPEIQSGCRCQCLPLQDVRPSSQTSDSQGRSLGPSPQLTAKGPGKSSTTCNRNQLLLWEVASSSLGRRIFPNSLETWPFPPLAPAPFSFRLAVCLGPISLSSWGACLRSQPLPSSSPLQT